MLYSFSFLRIINAQKWKLKLTFISCNPYPLQFYRNTINEQLVGLYTLLITLEFTLHLSRSS
jgi:hypothetical protein